MKHPKLSRFAKTHRLLAEFSSFAYGKDTVYWLDILKDYRIDLETLSDKDDIMLSFGLIPPNESDIFTSTMTIRMGYYDFFTLNIDEKGRLVYAFAFDDWSTSYVCNVYRDEYACYADPNYQPKLTDEECYGNVYIWLRKQKLKKEQVAIVILDDE